MTIRIPTDVPPEAVVIAPSNAPAVWKKRATLVCDGTADEEQWFDGLELAGLPESGIVGIRNATRPVVIAPGALINAEPLKIESAQRFHVAGCGVMTEIRPSAPMADVLLLNAANHGTVRDMMLRTLVSGPDVTNVVSVEKLAGSFGSVHSLLLSRLFVVESNFVNGIQIGLNSGNVDMAQVTVDGCLVNGQWVEGETVQWQKLLAFGDGNFGNKLNHWARNCELSHGRYLLHVDGVNGSARDMAFDGGEVVAWLNPQQTFVLDDFRAESVNRLVETAGANSNPRNVAITNGWFSFDDIAGDGEWIRYHLPGLLGLGVTTSGSPAFAPIVRAGDSAKTLTITMPGLGVRGNTAGTIDPTYRTAFSWPGTQGDRVILLPEPFVEIAGVDGSQTRQITDGGESRTVTANTTVQPTDAVLKVDASGGARTVTLQSSPLIPGRRITVRKVDASGNAVTVARSSADATATYTIDGAASKALGSQWATITLRALASGGYDVVSQFGTVT